MLIQYSSLLVAVLFVLIGCGKDNLDEKYYLKANQYLANKGYKEAIDLYSDAINRNQDFMEAYHNRGIAFLRSGRINEALGDFSEVIVKNPDYAPAYVQRSYIYYLKGALDQAQYDLQMVEELNYDSSYVDFLQALIFTEIPERRAEGRVLFKELLNEDSTSDLLTNIANNFWYADEYDSALQYLNLSLQIDPKLVQTWNTLGLVYNDIGNPVAAVSALRKAEQINPSDSYVLNNLGLAYLNQNNMDSAFYYMNQSQLIDRSNPWLYRNLGMYYLAAGDPAKAENAFLRAEELNPNLEEINYFLAQAYTDAGEAKRACDRLARYTGDREIRGQLDCP